VENKKKLGMYMPRNIVALSCDIWTF